MRHLKQIFLAVLVVILLTGCTTTPPTDNNSDIDTNSQSSNDDNEVTEEEDTADLVITMGHNSFDTELIEMEPGETITVRIENIEGEHDFVIDELDIDTGLVKRSQPKTIEITIPEDTDVGTEYSFYCSVSNHRQLGMEGTIRVI